MKKVYRATILGVCVLGWLTIAGGCYLNLGYGVEQERIVRLSAPLARASVFVAQTHNGSITVRGAETARCDLAATIVGRAATEEQALKIAEQTKVSLVPYGNKLTVRIDKPILGRNQSVSVSLEAIVPGQTNAELSTHNGSLRIENITGTTRGKTHNGRITASNIADETELQTHNGRIICKNITGNTKLTTHNGSINCEEVSGDTDFRTYNGKINAVYSRSASGVFGASLTSYNGGIDFTAPPNISAVVDISTHNGSIDTKLPITIAGKVSKRKLSGTIGTGQGKLHLESYNGSIKIK